MTYQEWAEANGITLEALPAASNPNATDWGKDAYHWSVNLKKNGAVVFTTPYSMGAAYRRWTKDGAARARYESRTPKYAHWKDAKAGERIPQSLMSPRTLWEEDVFKSWTEPMPPDLAEVLECLALDAQGAENARCFEAWASEYGYDTDSRKAEETYRVCERQAALLARGLGEGAFAALLECRED